MVRRSKKKSRTGRGSRTYGTGGSKKNRGKAHKGGNPNQGWNKRHWIRILVTNPERIGKHGFTSIYRGKSLSINVGQLDQIAESLLKNKLAEREGNKIVIQASKIMVGKILGSGRVTKPLVIISPVVTESAKKKIEQAGGEVRNA